MLRARLPEDDAAQKDNFGGQVCPPGPELEQRIRDCWHAGCRVWHAGSAIAPRTASTYLDLHSFPRPRVGIYLEIPAKWAWDQLTTLDRDMVRHLGAAVRYDLYGVEWDALARGYWLEGDPRPRRDGGPDPERAARREVELGRALWAKLDAWPWAWWPNGIPRDPRGWRKHGAADPRLAAAFQTWATGHPILP